MHCFVVSPIGQPGSETRKRSNGYLREVIRPVAESFGYEVERADDDKAPGVVTEGIVEKLVSADLIVADLHGHNPNVLYEVAIRHATGKPIIQMIESGDSLPFDIGGLNTIFYDPSVDGLQAWREDLTAAIQSVSEGASGENPVSRASMFRALRESGGEQDKALVAVLESVEQLRREVRSGRGRSPKFEVQPVHGSTGEKSRILLLPNDVVHRRVTRFLDSDPTFAPFRFMVHVEDKKIRVVVLPSEFGEPAVGEFEYQFDWDDEGRINLDSVYESLVREVTRLLAESAEATDGSA